MPEPCVEALFLAPMSGDSMQSVGSIEVEAGRGIVGDRHWQAKSSAEHPKAPERELTLIEAEAVEALPRDQKLAFEAAESRRNVLTRGVALNHLVGREFRVGTVRLRGIELCEPCRHLEKLTRPGVMKALLHRGGLRARILEGGTLRVGDPVEIP